MEMFLLIFSTFLLLALGQDMMDTNLDYSTLSRSQDGRHFLMTTLLERLYEPISAPRFRGRVVFQLPASLGGSGTFTPSDNFKCCELKEVPFKYRGGVYTESILRRVLEKNGLLKYPKDAPIFDFDAEVKKDINMLADIINGDQRPFDHMISLAAAVKDMINDSIFAKAVVTITVRRTDVGMAVPNLVEVMAKDFLPSKKQLMRQVRQLDLEDYDDTEAPMQEILVDWESPQYRTYPDSEVESKLWYLREDPQVNSHHWYWHILFGDLENFNKDELQHRRGELFYYLHNQVCNRYNFERLSLGMDLVEPFGPEHWENPIPLGYDPKLGDLSALYYPPRRDNVHWYGHPESTKAHKKLVSAVSDAIQKGYMVKPNGERVELGQRNGRDFGIIPLGAVIEKDPLRTVNNETYGDVHNGGHKYMSKAGLHPQIADAGIYNAVGNTATECRDPLLYRWHAYVDGIFGEYKLTLPEYKDSELDFPGVELEDVSVHSYTEDENAVSGRTYIKDKLYTHMEAGDIGFYGLDINSTFSDRIRIKYRKLNHSPFFYRFRVRNSGAPQRGLVRIFLADEKGTPTQIEMDKFIWNFNTGTTEFERSYDDSSSVPRRDLGLYEIQESSYEGVQSNVNDPMINEYTGCGWAKHLLVPRGNPSGFKTNLLVVISPLLPEDDAATTNWETVSTLTHSLCGAPGAKFPDSRPMGYPFDRYRPWQGIIAGRSNMKRVGVSIFHMEKCSVDRECQGGNGCDTERGRCRAEKLTGPAPRRPRQEVLFPESCPIQEGTKPKIQVERAGVVPSASACLAKCREATDCSYFEWQEVKTRGGRCLLYHHVALQSGYPRSTSGKKKCSSTGTNPGTCTLKDQQPVLKYVRTWRRQSSAEDCQQNCGREASCDYWEFKVASLGDQQGTCNAYAMSFRSRAMSVTGPVQCSI